VPFSYVLLRLNRRLQTESVAPIFRVARLYFRMKFQCGDHLLQCDPERLSGNPHREEVLFQIVKTYQRYAKASIDSKKKERYNKAILAYNDLIKKGIRKPGSVRRQKKWFITNATRNCNS
ncbi:MAG: hypothetical protein MZU84_01365, partial [Sphingobacterium sp.]|nr:hypothetical protein [Sphingobacterium sp.]